MMGAAGGDPWLPRWDISTGTPSNLKRESRRDAARNGGKQRVLTSAEGEHPFRAPAAASVRVTLAGETVETSEGDP